MLNQRPDESHLFAGVVENDFRIRGVATEAVWSHNHGQVTGIHLGHGRHFGLRKDLIKRVKKTNNIRSELCK